MLQCISMDPVGLLTHWRMYVAHRVRTSAKHSRKNLPMPTLPRSFMLVSFSFLYNVKIVWLRHLIINFYLNSKCDTGNGFNHFPQSIEIIKNNLLVCKSFEDRNRDNTAIFTQSFHISSVETTQGPREFLAEAILWMASLLAGRAVIRNSQSLHSFSSMNPNRAPIVSVYLKWFAKWFISLSKKSAEV